MYGAPGLRYEHGRHVRRARFWRNVGYVLMFIVGALAVAAIPEAHATAGPLSDKWLALLVLACVFAPLLAVFSYNGRGR